MKNLTIYLIVFVAVIAYSCDSLLDVEAKNTISGDIYTNTENIQYALNGAYYNLGGISDGITGGELLGGDFVVISMLLAHQNGLEIRWDGVNAPDYSNFVVKEIVNTNLRVEANWVRAYEVINTVNTILQNIENVEDTAERARIQGESLAMRGILYFEMVRLWAPQYGSVAGTTSAIPLLTDPVLGVADLGTPPLGTIDAIYDRAETDLLEAIDLLDESGLNDTRLSHYACRAYLARLYMQKSEYDLAAEQADFIITSGGFSLAASPMDAFNNSENSTEDIFAIQQTLANTAGDRSTGTGLPNFYSSLSESGLGIFTVLGFSLGSSAFPAHSPKFSEDDLRFTVNLEVDRTTTSAQVTTAFYMNIANNNPSLFSSAKFLRGDNVIPVIRLAEMHLVRAEALFEMDPGVIDATALNDLNAIRMRAGLDELTTGDFGSPSAFYDSLVLERKRELLFEGQLLHDLKRWNESIASSSARDPKFILPIPQAELDTWSD